LRFPLPQSYAIVGMGNVGRSILATANALRHYSGALEAKAVITSGEPFLENEAVFHYMLA